MFVYDYYFFPKQMKGEAFDQAREAAAWFILSLTRSGQILQNFQNAVQNENALVFRVVAPEEDALHQNLYSSHTKKALELVISLSVKRPAYLLVGKNLDADDCCACQTSTYFVLTADPVDRTSPVLCGDCFRAVPLYRFAKNRPEKDYFDLLIWQEIAIGNRVQFLQNIGGRGGYQMLSNPRSKLAREGRRICRALAGQTGGIFYYELLQWYGKSGLCPSCGVPWQNQNREKFDYDLVCHRCHLVADKPNG